MQSDFDSPRFTSDIRDSEAYRSVAEVYERLLHPASDLPFSVGDLAVDQEGIVFSGVHLPSGFESPAITRAYAVGTDRHPRQIWPGARLVRTAPAGGITASVRARVDAGDEVFLSRQDGSNPVATWGAYGTIESISWCPDGSRLLIFVSSVTTENAGIRGAKIPRPVPSTPDWLPEIRAHQDAASWNSLWVWNPEHDQPKRLTEAPLNPWEAAWCGDDAILVVASLRHEEGSWYEANLYKLALNGSPGTTLYKPDEQVGCPAASPDGQQIAWIEGLCSSRGGVCGTLVHYTPSSGPQPVETHGAEITHLAWRDSHCLVYAGIRGVETVVGELRVNTGATREIWSSKEQTISGALPSAIPGKGEETLIVTESYQQGPAIVSLNTRGPTVRCEVGDSIAEGIGRIEPLEWTAPDGLEIQGFLILPDEEIPRPSNGWPLFVNVHGGPIAAHRNRWAVNLRATPVLATRGWAVFLPNPRGSAGRGQSFARHVLGDMGGADMDDINSGIDHLASRHLIDSTRVVISGESYGGFMSAWMVAHSPRFAASIPICPVANWTSQHFASNIPEFDKAFLGSSPLDSGGPYLRRSPVFQAFQHGTPTLVLGGLLDHETPHTQAVELYGALRKAGAPCALGIYPNEGHGLYGISAYIDSAARIVAWIDRHVSC